MPQEAEESGVRQKALQKSYSTTSLQQQHTRTNTSWAPPKTMAPSPGLGGAWRFHGGGGTTTPGQGGPLLGKAVAWTPLSPQPQKRHAPPRPGDGAIVFGGAQLVFVR